MTPEKSVRVYIEGVPFQADKQYEYLLPAALEEVVCAGSLVRCPFGRGSRAVRAVVVDIREPSGDAKLKEIEDVFSEAPVLDEKGLRLCAFMKERYFCPFFEAAKTVMAPGTVGGFDRFIRMDAPVSDDEIRGFFEANKNVVSRKNLAERLGKEKYAKVLRLIKRGELVETLEKKSTVADSVSRGVRVLPGAADYVRRERRKNTTAVQKRLSVLDYLLENGEASVKDVLYMTGVSASVLKTLEKYGVLEFFEKETPRNPLKNKERGQSPEPRALNAEQQKAFDEISKNLGSGGAHLLYGVTGSGKTHVFTALADEVLARGKSVLLLLPEISLTLQIIDRLINRYGDLLAVLHSGLSVGERYDEYKRIRAGVARFVVGTRSAVFAPVENLGLVIVDEEQEHTYKSEKSPRYDAKAVAGYRVAEEKALLLVASATPSFESFYKAKKGRIGFSVLRERYNGEPLPKVLVDDMSRELAEGGRNIIGSVLAAEIAKNAEKHEQTILFMNRRGYNSFVQCPKCKYVFTCKSCGIPMTYHAANDRLVCHYCGESRPAATVCPVCGSKTLKYSGYGTQRAEREIKALFPELRVLRMDADTVGGKNSRDEILSAFARREYNVLLGTQMITKGLDFPDVTLVGVLSADSMLYSSDFRAYEKTFSLLTQVVGRAGRADKQGRAVIQTFSPTHLVLEHAIKQDYEGFFEEETALRKLLVYPPFCDVCQCVFTADSLSRAFEAAEMFLRRVEDELKREEFAKLPLTVIRARQTAVPMVGGRDRVRILVKCRDDAKTRRLLREVYLGILTDKNARDITVGIDMNPTSIV